MVDIVRIIGMPIDLGQQQRGVDMGPSAIRYAGLTTTLENRGYTVQDAGNIDVAGHYSLKDSGYSERLPLIQLACEELYCQAHRAIVDGVVPIFLGGDHSAAIGSIGGVTHEDDCGVIWIDAHGDYNTPTISTTCNVHGMSLAILLGNGPDELVHLGRRGAKLKAKNVVLIGVRDLDHHEKKRLKDSGCSIFTMREIDELGMCAILKKALFALSSCARLHVSLDMDSIDPNEAPGVGTPVAGGLTYREAQLIMETICDTGKLHSLDIMETNPILDISNRTAQVAVRLVASLFGKKII